MANFPRIMVAANVIGFFGELVLRLRSEHGRADDMAILEHGRVRPATRRPMSSVAKATTARGQSAPTPAPALLTRAVASAPVGNQATLRRLSRTPPRIQPKLEIGAVDDPLEHEADAVTELVMRMPEPGLELSASPPRISRKCAECEAEEDLQTKRASTDMDGEDAPVAVDDTLRSTGQPLSQSLRGFFEPRFGMDFSDVRVHRDELAARSAQEVGALAYTVGKNIVFAAGHYAPETPDGKRLLSHELAHVVQQGAAGRGAVRRKLGDGHDLTSPRFTKIPDLEAAYDGESGLTVGNTGRGVQAVQQALYDIGYKLPASGADGHFGGETAAAVKQFQTDNALVPSGVVDKKTMAVLDAKFPAVVLPAPASRAAPWTPACVRSILCPWSPHTVSVLKDRITLKSYDSISWDDEKWDGAAWVPAPFPGGGFANDTHTEIGVLNSSCESMSQTLYHEVLHTEQPTTQKTTKQTESYAYRIGEEFSISLGLSGRPGLRSADATGRQFADPAKVESFVSNAYPAVPAGGGNDEIIGKGAALGEVQVQRPDGTTYVRAAAVGEKIPGPIHTTNEVVHPAADWTCP